MSSNLGEILRAKLAERQFMEDTKAQAQPAPTSSLPPHKQNPGKISNNINRATFEYVRDNPCTRADAIKAMVERGYKDGSVGAVLSMMVSQRLVVRDVNGVMHATVKEYVPLKNSRALEKELKKQAKAKVMPRKNIVITRKPVVTATVEEKVEEKRPVSAPVWSVDAVINNLSVVQARELLDVLKNLFGEIK